MNRKIYQLSKKIKSKDNDEDKYHLFYKLVNKYTGSKKVGVHDRYRFLMECSDLAHELGMEELSLKIKHCAMDYYVSVEVDFIPIDYKALLKDIFNK